MMGETNFSLTVSIFNINWKEDFQISELPHFKNGSGGRPPKFGRTYDEKGGHSIKQEDRWQKWANLGGQIAKNAMVNGGKGGQMAKTGKFWRTNC